VCSRLYYLSLYEYTFEQRRNRLTTRFSKRSPSLSDAFLYCCTATFPHCPCDSWCIYEILGLAVLLPVDVSLCSVLSAVVAPLLHLTIVFKCVAAKILLQCWKHDHRPATNFTDVHSRCRLPSYEITRHIHFTFWPTLVHECVLYNCTLSRQGPLCKFVAAKIYASALETDDHRSATNFRNIIGIIIGFRVSDRCSLLFRAARRERYGTSSMSWSFGKLNEPEA
jgi:hypothetical protein